MNAPSVNGTYDVVVVGGGPSGTALATLLQRQGHRCLVLEGAAFPRYHIGESLIPNTYGMLDRLGLLPRLRASAFPKKYSVRFVAPSGEESQPFYFTDILPAEQAQTWQVERSAFDVLCLENARDNGVEVRTDSPVEGVLFDCERAVGVQVCPAQGEPYEVTAQVIADASGRAGVVGRQLGLQQPVPGLNKASIWSYYRGGRRLPGIDGGETTVFMLPRRGWFWYIPLPEDVVSVGVVADPDYLFDAGDAFPAAFQREVERCAPLQERLAPAQHIGPVRGLRRLAYRHRELAGNGWVMIGDAAAFLDPIYSSGLYLALASAEMAAGCVHDALTTGDHSAQRLGAFHPALLRGVEVVSRLINAFYDEQFSFRAFIERYPHHRPALVECLVGDVVDKPRADFLAALATMTPPPETVW